MSLVICVDLEAGEHNGNEDETPVVLATSVARDARSRSVELSWEVSFLEVHADATDVAADDDNGAEEIETDEEKVWAWDLVVVCHLSRLG